jgi:hypothetical protein
MPLEAKKLSFIGAGLKAALILSKKAGISDSRFNY